LKILLPLLFSLSLFPNEFKASRPKNTIHRIIIDPGHGGKDPGAHGKTFKEKDITLAIALELKKQFQEEYPEIKIILSREKDEFIELDDRASLAKRKKADLFISIHCNANSNSQASGSETYAIGINSSPENLRIAERENSVILMENHYKERYEGFDPNSAESYIIFSLIQQYTINQSLKLASKIEDAVSHGGSSSRGIKQAGFLVLRRNTVPSILLETGFITNPQEEKKLGSPWGQKKIAREIMKGFKRYIGDDQD
jgi:N-acetylmuramoyl-L-alanine amidase